ncbi:WecB/TagA/CpsF family glycosyltransferase [Lysinibacillus sp. FSL P2-0066]|uniref:WecB/TagA/CpsF family glycosyltransferase n=1 Tax=Lysinibacillus sp. FSL P2-0066 TaxID=2921720 RepID=UPI0030DAD28D
MNETVNILDIPFSKLTLNETTTFLTDHIEQDDKLLHLVTVNPEIAINSEKDELLKKIILDADMITPDGEGIVIASKRIGDPIKERVTGYELLLKLLEKGNHFGWSFYFLGTDESTSYKAVETIKNIYPNIKISGRHHGFFNESEEIQILKEIQKTKPNLLVIALGSPYSDKWIFKYKQQLSNVKVVFGVGGSLDVISGKVKPTPLIWKRLKLEWLFRLIVVPAGKGQKSRWRRQLALPKFFYRAIIKKGN